jgi:hypothetical protein
MATKKKFRLKQFIIGRNNSRFSSCFPLGMGKNTKKRH